MNISHVKSYITLWSLIHMICRMVRVLIDTARMLWCKLHVNNTKSDTGPIHRLTGIECVSYECRWMCFRM